MKLGTLLAAGKSLALGRGEKNPYRAHRQFYLPQFGSPKKTFASANQPGGAIPSAPTAAAPVKTPITVVAAKTQKLPTFSPARRAVNDGAAALPEPAPPVPKPRRALGWMNRLNPFGSHPGLAAGNGIKARVPVQAELSLDAVKVLRNDLSDADVEMVPLKSRTPRDVEVARPEPARRSWGFPGERLLKMKTS